MASFLEYASVSFAVCSAVVCAFLEVTHVSRPSSPLSTRGGRCCEQRHLRQGLPGVAGRRFSEKDHAALPTGLWVAADPVCVSCWGHLFQRFPVFSWVVCFVHEICRPSFHTPGTGPLWLAYVLLPLQA